MDILGFTLVYIYIYIIYIQLPAANLPPCPCASEEKPMAVCNHVEKSSGGYVAQMLSTYAMVETRAVA